MSFFDSIRESEIRDICRFWLARRKASGAPARSSIDPSQIPHRLLPYLFIFTRDKDGRFLCRLVGTALTRAYGTDDTGRRLDEILPIEAAAQRLKLYEQVLRTGLPAYMRGLAVMPRGEQRRYGRILLPIASRGRTADQILGLTKYGPSERPVPETMAMRALAQPRLIVFASDEDMKSVASADAEVGARIAID